MSSVTAIIDLGNNEYLITEDEYMGLSNQVIADYMVSQFEEIRRVNDMDGFYIYYDIVRIEPTHENNMWKVYNSETITRLNWNDIWITYYMEGQDWGIVNQLLTNNTNIITYNLTQYGLSENYRITPSLKQAQNKAVDSYYKAISNRDWLINQTLINI